MSTNRMIEGRVYLTVSKKGSGWGSNALKAKISKRPPRSLSPGEYVLDLKLMVPEKCLTQRSGRIDVTASAPLDATAEPQSPVQP